MNRYVSVPRHLIIDGQMPQEALSVAKVFSLEIKTEENANKIQIVAQPAEKNLSYYHTYSVGKIWALDIHDEFIQTSNDCYMLIGAEKIYPKLQEFHIVKFRTRPQQAGFFEFSIYIGGKEYVSGRVVEN